MFSPKIIEAKRVALSASFAAKRDLDGEGKLLFGPGFEVVEHSPAQVLQANEHIARVRTHRTFTPEELRWIQNERAMCSVSFTYWATRYGYITDIAGNLIQFRPNLAQRIILDQLASMEDLGVAMVLQILKARQEGVSTLAEFIILWRTMFKSYAHSLVASSRPEKSAEMVQKMGVCYDNQPSWLVPKIVSQNVGEFIGFDDQKSRIHIGHGAMLSGLGRGYTVTTFHLSELAEYLDADEAVDASLMRGAHDSPWLIGLLEGTGKTRSGWWYQKWNYNVEHWPLGEARMCPVFLPWYILRDLYPNETWMKAHPVRWQSEAEIPDLARKMALKAEEYVSSGENEIVTKALGSSWSMPREQMWWWWVERMDYESRGKLNDFYRELPASALEAFQSDQSAIFGPEVIEVFRNDAKKPWGVYGIRGDQAEIPISLQVREDDIDPNTAPIHIHSPWGTGPSHNYTLYPLLHRGSAPFSPLGKVLLYEPPIQGEEYLLGTDTSNGLGQDNSVIQGLKKGNQFHNDKQVFEFASPHVNSFSLWAFNLALGTLYAVRRGDKIRQPKQVIEGNLNGENVYNELKKRGWSAFHNWVRLDKKQVRESRANRQLWYTVSWSRELMLDMLLDSLNNGWLEINSPWFIDEMAELEVGQTQAGRQKIAAAIGQHDDRIMALGIALFSAHALETKGRDGWATRRAREQGPSEFARYGGSSQGSVEMEYFGGPEPSYRYSVVKGGDFSYEDLRKDTERSW